MGSPVEFPLRAWRRPVRYGLLLWLAVMMWFPATGGLVMLHVGRALALLGGRPSPAASSPGFSTKTIARSGRQPSPRPVEAHVHGAPRRRHRAAPGGRPRPVRRTDCWRAHDPAEVGPPSVIIDPARLGVPVAVVKAAVAAWVAEAGDDFGAAFANETARAQERNARRMKVMRWCGILAAACAALRLAAMLVEGK